MRPSPSTIGDRGTSGDDRLAANGVRRAGRNGLIRLAFLRDRQGALAAYQAHLASPFGRPEAGTEDARAMLGHPRREASGH